MEGAIGPTNEGGSGPGRKDKETEEVPSDKPTALDRIRRNTVTVTGGTLTAAGFVLIPYSIVHGCLIIYGGLAVLATKFNFTKEALDEAKKPIERWLADNDDDVKGNGVVDSLEEERHNSSGWEKHRIFDLPWHLPVTYKPTPSFDKGAKRPYPATNHGAPSVDAHEVQLAISDLSMRITRGLPAQFLVPQHAVDIIPYTTIVCMAN